MSTIHSLFSYIFRDNININVLRTGQDEQLRQVPVASHLFRGPFSRLEEGHKLLVLLEAAQEFDCRLVVVDVGRVDFKARRLSKSRSTHNTTHNSHHTS